MAAVFVVTASLVAAVLRAGAVLATAGAMAAVLVVDADLVTAVL
jgi:hypothetical protein